jgi:tetratricopeptide (TPR) repeat protein
VKDWSFSYLLLLLAACASSPPPAGPPQDPTLARFQEAGHIAYDLDRPQEAVRQFEEALRQAEARDDLAAIAELSFNLAVAQLRANAPQDALATTTRIRAELGRRGASPAPALLLAEATALYRTNDVQTADALAAEIEGATDRDVAAGASFLRGLISDETNDIAGLQAAHQRLGNATTPLRIADRQELEARLALRQNDVARARSAATQSANTRQEILDYRGMARSLSVAGKAAAQAGDNEAAADFYLRAGRSAAAQGDAVTARPWLEMTRSLSRDPAIDDAAERALATLGNASPAP